MPLAISFFNFHFSFYSAHGYSARDILLFSIFFFFYETFIFYTFFVFWATEILSSSIHQKKILSSSRR